MGNFKIAFAVLFLFNSLTYSFTYDQVGKKAPKIYGNAKISKIYKGHQVYSFSCDVKDWPAIIGENIPVRIAGIDLPAIVADQAEPNKFFQRHTIKFLNEYLNDANEIELVNIQRGKDFCLVADVIADSNSLAEILIEEGLAEKFVKGKSSGKPKSGKVTQEKKTPAEENITWIAAASSKVFHKSTCTFVKRMKKDKTIQFPTREKAIETGRRPCRTCKP